MDLLNRWTDKIKRQQELDRDFQRKVRIYEEVSRAKAEWERAYMAFQQAVGDDEIDFAVYTLEAAERRYQIHLKEAKKEEARWGPLPYGTPH
ncbi:DUF2508 family protein [Paenibacillus sp. YPG26]|uniref:DUF2508 family protein n=1 Tax=Paenibacillus sp. YPG26 TaxID=2878915 RepID=UPI00203DB7B2|nr:DUF2508 family protein [Paenibacillus sp. YPG26]USB33434.1 YaaL family protein [Paenibacillus sp. YPG26]